jgi:uncharacterized protein YbbK (DUF523 family)
MKVIASACCCGFVCRWNGKKYPKSAAIKRLEADGIEVVPVCPEMLGGLPCPRPPVRRKKGRVYQTDPETKTFEGPDVLAEFTIGAQKTLELAQSEGITKAYLLWNSPSCAKTGITGRLLIAAGIEVIPIY